VALEAYGNSWARQDGKAAAKWARGLHDTKAGAIAFDEAVGA
jgi:hypothetical protein